MSNFPACKFSHIMLVGARDFSSAVSGFGCTLKRISDTQVYSGVMKQDFFGEEIL